MSDKWPKIISVVLGVALTLFFLVYLPMKGNHDECGRITLCQNEGQP